jgi:hypothetical protein
LRPLAYSNGYLIFFKKYSNFFKDTIKLDIK